MKKVIFCFSVLFIFKNGATPKDKFFLVLGKDIQGGLLLASLPTSKDHVPSDVEVKHGCLDIAERFVNVFVFISGEEILNTINGGRFSFSKNTFIYGSNLDIYNAAQFELQERLSQTSIELIGTLGSTVFTGLKLSSNKESRFKYITIQESAFLFSRLTILNNRIIIFKVTSFKIYYLKYLL